MGYNLADLQGEKAERIASALEAMALNGAGQASTEQNWLAARNLVRAGLGPKAFPVGKQFIVHKESSLAAALGTHAGVTAVTVDEEAFLAAEGVVGSGVHEFKYDGAAWVYGGVAVRLSDFGLSVTGTPADGDEIIVTEAYATLLFDVVDHRTITDPITGETKPGMVLMMHHCIYGRAFDASEAVYSQETELAAGNYYFVNADESAYYPFTLASAVPANGQIVLVYTGDDITGIKTYAGPTDTVGIETVTTAGQSSPPQNSTMLGKFADTANHTSRCRYGSNNYQESAIRRWINSAAVANAWWSASNKYDRPVGYTNVAGLLHGMDADFLAVVGPVTVPCKTNNTFELPGWTLDTAYTVQDKFFLASRDEMGYGVERVAEGSAFALYNGADNVDRIKRDQSAQSTARYWWLRSPSPGTVCRPRNVDTSGALSSSNADNGLGAAAACIIY